MISMFMLNNGSRLFRDKFGDEQGFTLVEMIFVVLLLAALVSVASFSISGIQEQATSDLAWVDLKIIRSAARTFYLETRRWPIALAELSGYLDEIPDDKFLNGSGTKYSMSADGNVCTVKSVGPDRRLNTADDLILTFSP